MTNIAGVRKTFPFRWGLTIRSQLRLGIRYFFGGFGAGAEELHREFGSEKNGGYRSGLLVDSASRQPLIELCDSLRSNVSPLNFERL